MYICLPTAAEAQKSIYAWERQTRIPGIVGALDGTHIAIRKPSNRGESEVYWNRKSFYSINVQGFIPCCGCILIAALVEYRKRFIDVEVGWPGSVGDGRVFKNSRLNNMYKAWLSQFPTKRLSTGETDEGVIIEEEIPAFILTDSAYTNSKHLVTMFKLNECNDSVVAALNKRLSDARYHVENAFEILKGRFQIFQRPLQCATKNIEFAIMLISALFVLHNFLIEVKDDSGDWAIHMTDEYEGNDLEEDSDVSEDMETTRNILLRHMRWDLANDDD